MKNRSNIACASIFLATFLTLSIWQPSTKEWTPLSRVPSTIRYQTYDQIQKSFYTVTYDSRTFQIDGYSTILLGGSIHYPRSTPGMWDTLFQKAKDDGLNLIQLYVFWNLHEKEKGRYDFTGGKNITLFFEKAKKHGLFLSLRIGPYVCAEWNNGGLPVWLNGIPGIRVRKNNEPWKIEMERFVRTIATIASPYLAKNGGPIIAAQIENEYQLGDKDYVQWCGKLASSLEMGVPWIMCNGMSAPGTIGACNDNDCVNYAINRVESHPNEPLLWTENEGWFQQWDRPVGDFNDLRSPQSVAYAIARWFAIGGSYHNYYMYHGGNNYGRGAAAGITNMYADGVNIHSDGLDNEPKKSHLRHLHFALIKYQNHLLESHRQLNNSKPIKWFNAVTHRFEYGKNQRVFEYGHNAEVAFVENFDSRKALVQYRDQTYHIAAQSILIIDNSLKQLVFNTSDVQLAGIPTKRVYTDIITNFQWRYWKDDFLLPFHRKIIKNQSPVEQLSVTLDSSDYCIYSTFVESPHNAETTLFVDTCQSTSLMIFMNNTFVGETYNNEHIGNCSIQLQIKLPQSNAFQLSILSTSLGIGNLNGLHYKGLVGDIGFGNYSLRNNGWTMSPGLTGESLEIFTTKYKNSVDWKEYDHIHSNLTAPIWLQSEFNLPPQDLTTSTPKILLLDANGLTRGRFYVNGKDLGRYWLISYKGKPVQRYYHIPNDWLTADSNLLTIIEEIRVMSLDKVKIVSTHKEIPSAVMAVE